MVTKHFGRIDVCADDVVLCHMLAARLLFDEFAASGDGGYFACDAYGQDLHAGRVLLQKRYVFLLRCEVLQTNRDS